MKSLEEFVNESTISEGKINGELLKDLKVCVKIALENYLFDNWMDDGKAEAMKILARIVDGRENDTWKDWLKKFSDTYDFDTTDPDVMEALKDSLMEEAKKLIDEYKLAERYEN